MYSNENSAQPLESSEDISQYLLHSRSEILYILRELIAKKIMVTVYFNHGKDFILTAMLTVLPERGAIVFDCGAQDALNQKLLESDRIIFVAAMSGIRIQFVTTKVREVKYQGKDAFIADFPEQLLRLQRREFYRLEIPAFAQIECTIPDPSGGTSTVLPIHDISLGGLSVVADKQFEKSRVMEKFHHCSIELKDFGTVISDLEVRTSIQVTQRSGPTTRLGCKFIELSPTMQTSVQRYMVSVEKERRAMSAE